jgi:2-phospho-L-lactate guanylyltransferase
LNQAIVDGARVTVGAADGQRSGPVAVLPGDLPSLLPGELAAALSAAASHPCAVVADKQGTGTTLLAASDVSLLQPRYGPGSLGRHLADGAVRLDVPEDSGLRRDVDHLADLPDVTGPRTVAVLERAGFARERCASRSAV